MKNPFFLAPMAGITDSAFRTICAKMGAAHTYTEMVSAKALVFNDKKTHTIMHIDDDHRPCAVQLFGSEPDTMYQAAQIVQQEAKPDFIDINMGCPVQKIVANGEGSALMRDLKAASEIICAVKRAVSVPVTVKFRSGYDNLSINAVEFAKMAEQSGVSAMCIHGRTRTQMYSGKCNRDIIRKVKQAVSTPVYASGDIFSCDDAFDTLEYCGVDGVMIARGAQGNPHIFAQCAARLEGKPIPQLTADDVIDTMRAHAYLMCERKGGERALVEFRKHALWYLSRIKGAKGYKIQMAGVATLAQFDKICNDVQCAQLALK